MWIWKNDVLARSKYYVINVARAVVQVPYSWCKVRLSVRNVLYHLKFIRNGLFFDPHKMLGIVAFALPNFHWNVDTI